MGGSGVVLSFDKPEIIGEKEYDVTFVVHGAKTRCSSGDSVARLIVPESHGVYLNGKAQLNAKDSKPHVNVQRMGICRAASLGFEGGGVSRFQATVNSILGRPRKGAEEQLAYTGALCNPQIDMDWVNAHEEVLVDGEKALTNKSYLACIRCGKIEIVDDGQRG